MKQSQTFKFDAKLIDRLKKEAKKKNRPFNRYVEWILEDHLEDIKGFEQRFIYKSVKAFNEQYGNETTE